MIELAYRRPRAAVLTALTVAGLGLIAAWRLPVTLLPPAGQPRVTVMVAGPDAPIEAQVGGPIGEIEGRLRAERGVRAVTLRIQTDWAMFEVELAPRADPRAVELRLRGVVDEVTGKHPELLAWVYAAHDGREGPFAHLLVTAPDDADLQAAREFAVRRLAPTIARLEGVAAAEVVGGRQREVVVRTSDQRLRAQSLALGQLVSGLRSVGPAPFLGRWRNGDRQIDVVLDRPDPLAGFRQRRLGAVAGGDGGGRSVAVADVSSVDVVLGDERHRVRSGGRPAVAVAVTRTGGSDLLRVSQAVRERAAEMIAASSGGLRVEMLFDEADTIRETSGRLVRLALGGSAAALVVGGLFLGGIELAVAVAVVAPVAILGTLFVMQVLGIGLNIVTMCALAVGIGLLVDASAVVVENIAGRRETSRVGAVAATREVVWPLFAGLATTVVVFVPAVLFAGAERAVVAPAAVVVTTALVLSLVLAITVVPAVAGRIAARPRPTPVGRLRDRYARFLAEVLRAGPGPPLAVALGLALGFRTAIAIPYADLFSEARAGELLVRLALPEGGEIEAADRLTAEVERRIEGLDVAERTFTVVRRGGASIWLTLAAEHRAGARARRGAEQELRDELAGFQLGAVSVSKASDTSRRPLFAMPKDGLPVPIRIRSKSIAGLLTVEERLAQVPTLDSHGVRPALVERSQGLRLEVDTVTAARAGIRGGDVLAALHGRAETGLSLGTFRLAGEQLPLTLRVEGSRTPWVAETLAAPVRGARGEFLLAELGTLRPALEVTAATRVGGLYEVETEVPYLPCGTPECNREARARLVRQLRTMPLPHGVSLELLPDPGAFPTAEHINAALVAGMVLFAVFAVLALLLESLRLPLVALAATPGGLAGGCVALWLAGSPWTTLGFLGAFLLVGLTVNSGILLIHTAERARSDGQRAMRAIYAAATRRLRPTLMTAIIGVVALVPLALARDPENLWRPFALVLVGGLLAGLPMNLLFVPYLYARLLHPRRERLALPAVDSPSLEVRNLGRTYRGGTTALRQVSMRIGVGGFGLLGPNGAGKTTFVRILTAILAETRGSVSYAGVRVDRARDAFKRLTGTLPQECGMYPGFTVEATLDYWALVRGIRDRGARRRAVERALAAGQLESLAGRVARTLSGGQARRLGIAQALVHDPTVLVVDEPTVGLDPEARIALRELLRRLAVDRVVLLSSHIVEDVEAICRDVAVLDGGRLRFVGTCEEMRRGATGHVFQVLVSDVRFRDLRRERQISARRRTADGMLARFAGSPPADLEASAELIAPTMEEAYLWLVSHRTPTRGEPIV